MNLELHHRVNNSLAMIRASPISPRATATDFAGFRNSFSDRIQCLSRISTLLVKKSWAQTPMMELVTTALASDSVAAARPHQRFGRRCRTALGSGAGAGHGAARASVQRRTAWRAVDRRRTRERRLARGRQRRAAPSGRLAGAWRPGGQRAAAHRRRPISHEKRADPPVRRRHRHLLRARTVSARRSPPKFRALSAEAGGRFGARKRENTKCRSPCLIPSDREMLRAAG